jgi:hypothetical protein
MTTMPRHERENLQRLVRQRERVLKSAAQERAAELIADFENQLGQQFSFDQDQTWTEAAKAAEREVEKANDRIAARCAKLGIPGRFAPTLEVFWNQRGENATASRRTELRRMALTRIEAMERKAIVQIAISCLEAQTALAVAGLTSDAGQQFVEQLPKIETLMPRLSFGEVAGQAEPPIAEELVSSHALRQRRYRQRLASRRHNSNGHEASRDASCDASGVTVDDGLNEETT